MPAAVQTDNSRL